MKEKGKLMRVMRSVFACLIFMAIFLLAIPIIYQSEPKSWGSPGMDRFERKWDAIMDEYHATPLEQIFEKYGAKNDKLYQKQADLLRKNLSNKDIYQLVATCDDLSCNINNWSEFESAVLRYMFEVLVTLGDRERLVKLLATRAPDYIHLYAMPEFCLVYRGHKLKDPILILGEAYSRCESPEVRRVLMVLIRRGFAGHGIEGEDNTEFAENAMQWYEKEKDHLTVNRKYMFNIYNVPWEMWGEKQSRFERNAKGRHGYGPLFIKKE